MKARALAVCISLSSFAWGCSSEPETAGLRSARAKAQTTTATMTSTATFTATATPMGLATDQAAAAALTPADIVGFEQPSGWTTSSGSLARSTDCTQGTGALAVNAPINYTTLTSKPIGSQSSLGAELIVGGTVAIDLKLPVQQPNPSWYGAVQLFVTVPSRGVYNAYLGQDELTGNRVNQWQTYWFSVPSSVGSALQNQAYGDLTVTVVLNVPSSGTGTYLLDNLAGTPVKRPPGDVFAMPGKSYVLPVMLVPSDYWNQAPAPDGLHDLAGGSWNTSSPGYAAFYAVRNNLSVLIHQSRAFYANKLKNPKTGVSRGTFAVASWSNTAGAAFEVTAPPAKAVLLEPLVLKSSWSRDQIADASAGDPALPVYGYMTELMAAAGCQQASCPFHFVIVFLGDPVGEGSRPFNEGRNSPGGFGLFDFSTYYEVGRHTPAIAGGCRNEVPGHTGVSEQSTLVHELGHNFGLTHLHDYNQDTQTWDSSFFDDDGNPPLLSDVRYDQDCASSIMSYAVGNHIWNCKADASGYCRYDQAWVDSFPGDFLPEQIRELAAVRLAFPGLVFEAGLDAPGQQLLQAGSYGPPPIPGHRAFQLWPNVGGNGPFGVYPAFSGSLRPFLQYHDTFHAARAWRASPAGSGQPVTVTLDLPGMVHLTRLDVYSGIASTASVASITVTDRGGAAMGAKASPSYNQSVALTAAGSTDQVNVNLFPLAGGDVVLRGLRLWAVMGGVETELYPAAEPQVIAWNESSGAPAGTVQGLVGSTATVPSFGAPFDPAREWSGTTNGLGFLSLTVDFPEEVTLGRMETHTGSGNLASTSADAWQISRRCICPIAGKPADASWCATGNPDCAAGPADGGVFEWVISATALPNTGVSFAQRTARRWNVAFHSATPGARLSVRGVRFFTPSGQEIFPARSVTP